MNFNILKQIEHKCLCNVKSHGLRIIICTDTSTRRLRADCLEEAPTPVILQ